MAKLHEIAKYIRSKNAGPFWVTVDIFCDTDEAYRRVAESPVISAETVAALYGTDAEAVKLFRLPDLKVVKLSFPRRRPQGSPGERDMHSGQQYIPLLDLEI